MNLSDLVVSYIRTLVPVVVGIGLTYLAKHIGFVTPEPGLVSWVTGAFITGYYVLVRFLEARFPVLGVLLGVPKPPAYDPPAPAAG